MRDHFPPGRDLKMQARRVMVNPLCIRVTLLFVGLEVAFVGLRYLLGGTVGYYMTNLSDYANSATGFYQTNEGFSLIFRMDLLQTVVAVPLTYTQIQVFLLVNVVLFVLLAPMRLGAMEQYWFLMRGRAGAVKQMFQWYGDFKRLGKAVAVEFVLGGVVRLVGILALIPSFLLYYRLYTGTVSPDAWTVASSWTEFGALLLLLAAALFTFWLHSVLLPIRYCLAAHPEYSLGETFRRGARSLRGFRTAFFRFRLGFLIWMFLSQMTYFAMDLFVAPYTSLSGMVYLQEAARAREQNPPQIVS